MNLLHLIDFNDLTHTEWNMMYALACDIKKSPEKYMDACRGKIMATLFYEPSTRTKLSFQTAMLRLGGSFIGFADPNSSSVSKGESLRDTVKIVSGYADIAVIRHPTEGAAYAASLYSRVPVINAGDGSHLHPTQTLTDMFTIANEKGSFNGMSFGLCGDLLNGRTVHSLIKALSEYKNNTFYLISTNELTLPEQFCSLLDKNGNRAVAVNTLEECISELDILYMTRIQKERFASQDDYKKQAGVYVLTKDKLAAAKQDMIILHPLPKVDEIACEVDDDPRAKYFEQAENGMYIRMALILMLCDRKDKKYSPEIYRAAGECYCHNPRCITKTEKYLPKLTKTVNGTVYCSYCDTAL